MLIEIKYTEINISNIKKKKKSRSFQDDFLKRMKSKINEGLISNLIIF